MNIYVCSVNHTKTIDVTVNTLVDNVEHVFLAL